MVTQDDVLYGIRPETITQLSGLLLDTIEYDALAFQGMPNEQSLKINNKNYEEWKTRGKVGVGYELTVVRPPDSSFVQSKTSIETAILFSNYSMSFEDYLDFTDDAFDLSKRMERQINELRTRVDLITYMGDPKYNVKPLGTNAAGTGVFTEMTDQLDLTTGVNAALSFANCLAQLKKALKYSGIIGPNATIIVELTPDKMTEATGTVVATSDQTPFEHIMKQLRQNFPGGASRIIENRYLGGSFTVSKAGVHTITEGTDTCIVYVEDPRVMRTLSSGLPVRQSPLDETKGLVIQPVMRHTRKDSEPLGGLVETGLA